MAEYFFIFKQQRMIKLCSESVKHTQAVYSICYSRLAACSLFSILICASTHLPSYNNYVVLVAVKYVDECVVLRT